MQQPQGGFYSIVAWQKADDLAVKIYKITQKFPNYELYLTVRSFSRWVRKKKTGKRENEKMGLKQGKPLNEWVIVCF